jgi:hypothetical protein
MSQAPHAQDARSSATTKNRWRDYESSCSAKCA